MAKILKSNIILKNNRCFIKFEHWKELCEKIHLEEVRNGRDGGSWKKILHLSMDEIEKVLNISISSVFFHDQSDHFILNTKDFRGILNTLTMKDPLDLVVKRILSTLYLLSAGINMEIEIVCTPFLDLCAILVGELHEEEPREEYFILLINDPGLCKFYENLMKKYEWMINRASRLQEKALALAEFGPNYPKNKFNWMKIVELQARVEEDAKRQQLIKNKLGSII